MEDFRPVKIQRSDSALNIAMPGDVTYLAHIREFIADLALKVGFTEEDVAKIEMSVDEACTNVVEHAYATDKKWHVQHRNPEIRLAIQASENQIVIEINDHGQHFDFSAYQPAEPQTRAQDMHTGGYGIAIMRKFMDEVGFHSSAATGNTLRLVKYLKKT